MADEKPVSPQPPDEPESSAELWKTMDGLTEAIDLGALFEESSDPAEGVDTGLSEIATVISVAQALPIPALLMDGKGTILYANRGCQRLSANYKAFKGKSFASLFASEAAAKKADSLLENGKGSPKTKVAEGELRTETGSAWARMYLRPLRLGTQTANLLLVEYLAPTKRQLVLIKKHKDTLGDVLDRLEAGADERKPAEAESAPDAGEAVETPAPKIRDDAETARHYKELLDHAPVGFVLCNAGGDILEINREALRILGLPSIEAALATNLITSPPLVESGISSVIGKCLEAAKPVVSEFPNKIGAGKQIYCRLRVVPLFDGDGKVRGAESIIEDVLEQKQAESFLLQSERFKAVGEMAGAVAHNFNSLLQSLASSSRQALGYIETKSLVKVRPLLEQIFDGTREAVQTVRRLQQFSRARRTMGVSRLSHVQEEVFDLSEVVREAVQKCRIGSHKGSGRNRAAIALELDLAEGCYVEGEESEMVEVVCNLLKNAEEALPVGGRIRAKILTRKDSVVLQVQDNGVGILEKNLGRVFEPFWTSKDAHVGMGLAITFGIVRRHRGTVTVISRMRSGTTLTVKVPLARKPVQKSKVHLRAIQDSSFRVLLIDDDEPIVRLFEKGFLRLGHKADAVTSGQEGLKLFEEHEFDAVICDLAMTGMNGWEVARAVHEICLEKGIPKPPFIMLTGWAGQLAEDEILSHPDVDRIVEKPIKVMRLLEIVAKEIKASLSEAAFSGRVDGIDLIEYLQLVMLTGKPVVVQVMPRSRVKAMIFVDKGQVLHASFGDMEGEEALYGCLGSEGGSFSNLPWREPERITINKPGEFLLIEAARRRDELRSNGARDPDE